MKHLPSLTKIVAAAILLLATCNLAQAAHVYLLRGDRILAHFITCFLALLVFKSLKRQLAGHDVTTAALRRHLVQMDYLKVWGEGYIPAFEADEITTSIADYVSPELQNQIATERKMKQIIKSYVKVS